MKCKHCGHKHDPKDSWRLRCLSCGMLNLDTSIDSKGKKLHTLADVSDLEIRRMKSGEWDICWGSHWKTGDTGIANRSQTILGGEPGAGKSTFLLELADGLVEFENVDVSYIGTEEPEQQIKERADRLGIKHQNRIAMFDLMTHPDIDLQPIINKKAVIILDSIQGLAGEDLERQVDVAKSIQTISARHALPSIIISQINKGGDIAGLMKLQHACDTLMSLFTVDEKQHIRELTAIKNRNGETLSRLFKMTQKGLILLENFPREKESDKSA